MSSQVKAIPCVFAMFTLDLQEWLAAISMCPLSPPAAYKQGSFSTNKVWQISDIRGFSSQQVADFHHWEMSCL